MAHDTIANFALVLNTALLELTVDDGGPLEFIEHGFNGLVTEATPDGVAEALMTLDRDRKAAADLGEAWARTARGITRDGVIEKLLGVDHARG